MKVFLVFKYRSMKKPICVGGLKLCSFQLEIIDKIKMFPVFYKLLLPCKCRGKSILKINL